MISSTEELLCVRDGLSIGGDQFVSVTAWIRITLELTFESAQIGVLPIDLQCES
jgi:hypothetical protein